MTRTAGFPTSPNGASSFHLWWEPTPSPATSVSVVVRVDEEPAHTHLVFWALQVDFVSRFRRHGGAHVGLQWNGRHPDSRAANWGGYDARGRVLDGSESDLPSTPDDPNTRDYPWRAGVPYRLEVGPGSASGRWAATITDLATGVRDRIRELTAGGDRLVRPVVWSEVFARCDDPPVAVTWSDPRVVTPAGDRRPLAYRVSYQSEPDGGCSTTDVEATADGVRQITGVERTTPPGSVIPVPGNTGQAESGDSR